MHISVLTTGGTIDKIYFDALSEFQVGDPQIAEVLKHIHAGFTYDVRVVLRKDSLEFSEGDRKTIRMAAEEAASEHILVTHGTDTMCETGRVLQGIDGKTIVLTGALTPARFRETDAVFNIGFALACVQILPPGVYIAMNGRIFDPATTRKNREKNLFEAITD
ncbi:MAG: asparaginase domain-containing protein [Opitutaceae bacterium]